MPASKKKPVPVIAAPGARMLNVQAAAEYTGATVWFMRTLAWEKKVPSVILGNRLLFDRADLDSFLDRAKAGAA